MMLGAWELVVVAIAALLFLGPEKLPELARTLARLLAQVQKLASEARRSVNDALHEEDVPRRAALPVSDNAVAADTPEAAPGAGPQANAADAPSEAARAQADQAAAPFSAWVEREQGRLTQEGAAKAQAPGTPPAAAPGAAPQARTDVPSAAALNREGDN